MRFKDLARTIEACSDRVLVERLKELEKEDIVKRSVDQNTGIILYGLTKKKVLNLSQFLTKYIIGLTNGLRVLTLSKKKKYIT